MRKVVVFDFDGTLTHADTFVPFVRFALGDKRFVMALLKNCIWLIGYMLHLYPSGKAKQRLFATCFAGLRQADFNYACQLFARAHSDLLRPEAYQAIEHYLQEKATIYVVSASMEEWIKPLLSDFPTIAYITTRIEIKDGKLTGSFASPNCNGREKVQRFLAAEPARKTYQLYVYGNSRGDKEILSLADKAFYRTLQYE